MSSGYYTISVYIETRSCMIGKANAIQEVIDALELRLVDVAAGQAAVVDEYQMDDGQMKVRTSYRSVADVTAGVAALEKLKQKYINRANGRGVVLRNASSINKYRR